MVKVIEIKVSVPEWVQEEDVRRVIEDALERLSHRIPANKLREILGIKETTWDIEVPEELEKEILELRRKRMKS